ncbi:peptide-methionine (S)-S-oxide reductase [Aeromonas dhakensis]|uniref:peptide-methionine (S)-S-oxide reductase n=1 Tax=Aeromonas dhakensis TaxID=196024 RepID=UPI0035D471B2
MQVVFDPKVIGYGDLLKLFWEQHDPAQGRGASGVAVRLRLIPAHKLLSSIFLFVSCANAQVFIQGQGAWNRLFRRQTRCRDAARRW